MELRYPPDPLRFTAPSSPSYSTERCSNRICVVACKSEIYQNIDPHVSDQAIPCLIQLRRSGSGGFSSNYITKM